jgi:hypothetical protein
MGDGSAANDPWYKRYWRVITGIAVIIAAVVTFLVGALELPVKFRSAFGYGDAEIKMDEVAIRFSHEVQNCDPVTEDSVGSVTYCDAKHTTVLITIRKYYLSYILRKKYGIAVRACKPESDADQYSEFVEQRFDVDKDVTAEKHSVDVFLTNYSQKTMGVRVACDGQITPTAKLTLPHN